MNTIRIFIWGGVIALALLVLANPCAAYPTLSSSGISQIASLESFDSVIGPKNTWSSSEGGQYMMPWIKIVPGSELDNGVERYKYKYDIAAAGSPQSGILYGPFSFNQGEAKTSRQVDYLFLSGPGSYEVRFYVYDTRQDGTDLFATLPFTLQGEAQTTTTTAPSTTVSSTQVQNTYITPATSSPATTTATMTPSLVTTPVPVGSICVKSVPANAMVYFDDVERGTTPITLYTIPVGMHTIRVHTKGYTDNQTQVTIEDQKETLITITLLPLGLRPSTTITTAPVLTTLQTSPVTPLTGTPEKITFDGGPVTARDALAALQMGVGKIPVDLKYDMTNDGSVNSGDAQAILKIAVSSK